MSASETLCFVRNIGVLIGHWVTDKKDDYWKVIILLTDIIDIVTAPVIHTGTADYLQLLVSKYLSLLTSLKFDYLKFKHHILIHYSRLMKLVGPLWGMNTMRSESGNRVSKLIIKVSFNRQNPCNSIAIISQLQQSQRFECNEAVLKYDYEVKSEKNVTLYELAEFDLFAAIIPRYFTENLSSLTAINYCNICKK